MEYKFDDINIGDEVIFNSTPSQSNYDLYWSVIDKDELTKRLIIQLDIMEYKDQRWSLNIKDVLYHIPITKRN